MAALARSQRYIFARRRQGPPTEGSGGLLSPLSQLQFTGFFWSFGGLTNAGCCVCLDGEVEQGLHKHSSNSSRLRNYAWPNLSGSFLTVLTAAHTNRCLLIFPSFHSQKKSKTTFSTNSPPPSHLDSFFPPENLWKIFTTFKKTSFNCETCRLQLLQFWLKQHVLVGKWLFFCLCVYFPLVEHSQ